MDAGCGLRPHRPRPFGIPARVTRHRPGDASVHDRRIAPLVALAAWLVLVTAVVVAAGHLLESAEGPGGSTSVDRTITTWVIGHRTGALTAVAHGLSLVGSQVVLSPLVAVALLALAIRRWWRAAAALAGAWAGAITIYSVAKLFVLRPRPPRDLWLTRAGGTSFPSGHATQSIATFAALALVIALWSPRTRLPGRVIALVLAAGVGWSRVYLGVHWPTDVAAGWLAGAAWIALVALRSPPAPDGRPPDRRTARDPPTPTPAGGSDPAGAMPPQPDRRDGDPQSPPPAARSPTAARR